MGSMFNNESLVNSLKITHFIVEFLDAIVQTNTEKQHLNNAITTYAHIYLIIVFWEYFHTQHPSSISASKKYTQSGRLLIQQTIIRPSELSLMQSLIFSFEKRLSKCC